jgi:hypothetical protein
LRAAQNPAYRLVRHFFFCFQSLARPAKIQRPATGLTAWLVSPIENNSLKAGGHGRGVLLGATLIGHKEATGSRLDHLPSKFPGRQIVC